MSLFADDAITSDAMATGIMVMGLEKAKVFLKKHKELQAYMIYSNENGKIKMIHCPNSGVCIEGEGEPSYDMYWQKRFLFIKRLNTSDLLTTKTN